MRAAYLASLEQDGPKMLAVYPAVRISEKFKDKLALRSFTLGAVGGEAVAIKGDNYWALAVTNRLEVPGDRPKLVAVGLIVEDEEEIETAEKVIRDTLAPLFLKRGTVTLDELKRSLPRVYENFESEVAKLPGKERPGTKKRRSLLERAGEKAKKVW